MDWETYDWLGRWEPARYWDKHSRAYPADDGKPYRFCPVIRAIPVDGRVGASWSQSPQVRFWLDRPRMTMWERFVAWLNK